MTPDVPIPAPQPRQDRTTPADLLAGVESELAGAFFLLNVAFDLELYDHGFTTRGGLDLGVWDFIDLVARDVLGDEEPDDLLWALLVELADPEAPPVELSPADRDAVLTRVRTHLNLVIAVEDAGRFLLKRRGRIVRTPSHLDVHFPLERHPIEIRLARLDRNPGWLPAAGVHVGFHFN